MIAVLDRPTQRPDPVYPARPRAHGIALALLLVGTGVLYLWDLSINRYANDFYTAAIQAGSQSWKAWFFGSSDAANSITVDKPPLSLWIPGLAVRLFGLNSWSVLVPQALMGVATVAIVYAIGRRLAGPTAGLVTGVVMALTPVMVVMSRFDNPDALLVLLLTAAAWATVRILGDGRLRWALLAGGLLGLAFLTKQLQALVIVPAIGVAYLVFAAAPLRRRIVTLLAAPGALIVGAGWWVLAVELWPVSSRPYIGGTQHNSIIELTIGYNGLGRVTGDEASGIGGAPGRAGADMGRMFAMFGGHTGPLRMFSPAVGGQVAWLIPAALILGVLAIVLRGRAPRTDPERAALVFAGVWLVSTAALLSYMAGIFHPYYTLAFAPPIAILAGVGALRGWQQRHRRWVRATLVVTVVVTAVVAVVFLRRTPDFVGWLSWVVVAAAVVGVAGLLVDIARPARPVALTTVAAALVVGLAGPLAYSIDTVATPRIGGLVSAGPRVGSEFGFGQATGRTGNGRAQAFPIPGGQAALQAARRAFTGEAPPRAVVELLNQDASRYRWVAASVSSLSSAGYQLATGHPVMPVGGFVGSSEAMRRVQKTIGLVADNPATVLIGGETGTGKEEVARAIHAYSARRERPFVPVDCAAIRPDLLEIELFGHARGGFPGATADRSGAFAQAAGGTLFLDEVGDMAPAMQAKILRVIQDRTVTPLGGRPLRIDVRLVAATHRDLPALVAEGRFRADLYYRLAVVPIMMPPLRDRLADIVPLAEHFLAAFGKRLSAAAAARLLAYPWPGNVRELRNVVERAAVLVRGGMIAADEIDLPGSAPAAMDAAEDEAGDLPGAVARLERRMIARALEDEGGNRTRAAKRLGIQRQLLYAKIERYGLAVDDPALSRNTTEDVAKSDSEDSP